MYVLITYDLKFSGHTELKEVLKENGYSGYMKRNGRKYILPETTFIKKGISVVITFREVDAIIKELNERKKYKNPITFKNFIVVALSDYDWAGIEGEA